ncbi:MAG: 3-mercaptopyruvate sulfurtransferase [Gemmatimonadaceae bacterium]|nr:3-mercaptopyruvate sulfurtransferase [Gemmatimonadaceae bacterium]
MSIESFPTPLVSTAWLAAHLDHSWVKVIDASTYLPNAGRDARAEYLAAHIPGAVFCDIGWISDETAPFPHTLPTAPVFAERMGSLGISSNDAIIVYDGSGQNFSAPRLWWMLRVFGHHRVAVLDGGLRKWGQEGHAVDAHVQAVTPATFTAHLDVNRVRDIDAMRANLDTRREQVVDARSPGRFEGAEAEPRAGVRGGHIPHSVNLHYARLVRDDGTMRSVDELRRLVADVGLDVLRPITASCGTGVTACAVALALEVLGKSDTAVYDGSWTEWGSMTDTPVATGPA